MVKYEDVKNDIIERLFIQENHLRYNPEFTNGGTNKLTIGAFDKNGGESVPIIILNKQNNNAHGIDVDRGVKIAYLAKLSGHLYKEEFEDALSLVNDLDFLSKDKKEELLTKITDAQNNPEPLRDMLADFRFGSVYKIGVLESLDLQGNQSPNAYYIMEKISVKEISPDEKGNFTLEQARDQAIKYASYNQFMNNFYGADIYEEFIGTHDPYCLDHVLENMKNLRANETCLENIGVGKIIIGEGIPEDEVRMIYSTDELREVGSRAVDLLEAKILAVQEQKEEMESKGATKSHGHGDPWHDNVLGNFIIDREEAGTTFAIFDVTTQIVNKNGVGMDGKLNEIGQAIVDVSLEKGFIKQKDLEFLEVGLVNSALMIENMRIDKFSLGILDNRSPNIMDIASRNAGREIFEISKEQVGNPYIMMR